MMKRERIIKINLSGSDCDLLSELCGRYDLTIEELFENFVGDLVDGDYSNGSDERLYIKSWFDRCFKEAQDTLLSYLINQYDVYEFLQLIDSIAEAEQAWEDYKINPDRYEAEEIEFLQENLGFWKEQRHDMLAEWNDEHPEADEKKEIEMVRKWHREKESLINV